MKRYLRYAEAILSICSLVYEVIRHEVIPIVCNLWTAGKHTWKRAKDIWQGAGR